MSASDNGSGLHPAEHRAYRELFATSRQLLDRWRRLSAALEGTQMAATLESGTGPVRQLLEEVGPRIEAHGIHGGPAAQGAGATLGSLRSAVVDRSVDTGLAARMAVLDVEHVTTLLLQLAEMALARADEEMATFCIAWAKRLRPVVKDVRRNAVALGTDPERVAAPLDPSPLGQAIHRAGWAVGTLGEWFDRQVGGSGGEASDR